MTVFLDGIAAQFYRGIGADIQYIAPLARINFFIGANNAGKSIVLNLISSRLRGIVSGKNEASLAGPEVHRARETGQFLMAIGSSKEEVIKKLVMPHVGKQFHNRHGSQNHTANGPPTLETELRRICDQIDIEGCLWAVSKGHQGVEAHRRIDVEEALEWTKEWYTVWSMITGQSGGGIKGSWIPDTLKAITANVMPNLPNIHLIPAKRELGEKGEDFSDLTGRGLIDHLASLQSPTYDKQDDRKKFEHINRFLQEVTGKPNARLEVPHDREHLLVHMDNKVLPLSALGTGIHEVVLIAAFCTIHDGSIMCVEEPEIHLHPLLQRKLINYLIENTSSQYFIATHSSVFIDTPGANIFRVTNDGEQTRIKAVLTKDQQREILDDLGYQASDILQSNAVIWVEGPSDRIYLNHWVSAMDERLIEGIHYTIMFYGGGLIRHVTASDEALEEFIELRDLNRNMAIVIDSDREAASSPLKSHAQRIVDEMIGGGGLAWVTQGREIENYVDGNELQAALKQIHSRTYLAPGKTGPYDHAFYFLRNNPKKEGERITYKDGDKVGAANLICKTEARIEILDLRERLSELTAMICRANGIDQT